MSKQTRQERAATMRTERDGRILEAAVELAKEPGTGGYQWITRDLVAERAGVSVGSVNNAFGRMVELKRAVMREAVSREIVEIVAQGLADGSPIAAAAPPDLKARAARSIAH